MRQLPARFPILASCLAVALIAAPLPPAQAENAPQPVEYGDAVLDLNTLAGYIKDKKAINDQIIQYLDLVATAYVHMKAPDAPADDASEEDKAEYKQALAKFQKDLADFRKKADKLFFKAFSLARVRKETNQRDDVNARAAAVIGSLAKAYPGEEGEKARAGLSKRLRGATEKLKKIKYDLNTDTLGAAFNALGELGDIGSLEWMLDSYSHTKEVEQDWLIAAHTAMVKFPNSKEAGDKASREFAKGKLRFAIVDQFIKSYAGVESSANQSSPDPKIRAKKRFWDNIKNVTVPVLQHFAHAPKDPDSGEALATVLEFQTWLRKHKNVRKEPWADPK